MTDNEAVQKNLKVLTEWTGKEAANIVSNFSEFLELQPLNPSGRTMNFEETYEYYEAMYNISVDFKAQKLEESKTAADKQQVKSEIYKMIDDAQTNPVLNLINIDDTQRVVILGLLAGLTKF